MTRITAKVSWHCEGEIKSVMTVSIVGQYKPCPNPNSKFPITKSAKLLVAAKMAAAIALNVAESNRVRRRPHTDESHKELATNRPNMPATDAPPKAKPTLVAENPN